MIKNTTILIVILLIFTIALPAFAISDYNDENFISKLNLTNDEIEAIKSIQEREVIFGSLEHADKSIYAFEKIAETFDINYSIKYFSEFQLMLDSVKNGQVDFVGDITYTDERANYFDFSSSVEIEEVYIASSEKNIVENLSSKKIAAISGSIASNLITDNFRDVEIIYFENEDDIISLLEENIADGVVCNINSYDELFRKGYHLILLNDYIPISPVSIISKKDTNKTFLKAISKYIKTQEYQRTLSEFEKMKKVNLYKDIINEKKLQLFENDDITLKVKFENNPPYSSFDKNGNLTGLSCEVLSEVCDILEIEYTVLNNADELWSVMFDDLKEGKIDVLAPVSNTEERREYLAFSNPVNISKYIILNRSDYEGSHYTKVNQLIHERIGGVRGDVKSEFLLNALPQKELVYYDRHEDMINGLKNNEVDYIPTSQLVFYDYVNNTMDFSIKENHEIGTIFEREVCFAFPGTPEGHAMAELFNLAIIMIDVESIASKYIHQISIYDYYEQTQKTKNMYILVLLLAIIFLICVVFVYKNYAKKQS